MKLAVVFSGQGAQYEGMGQDLVSSSPAAALQYEAAEEATGRNQLTLTAAELDLTLHNQQATVTLDLAAFAALQSELQDVWSTLEPNLALAGFSLGEYAAFAVAEMLSPADLLLLVGIRAAAMDAACAAEAGAMVAILGLDDIDILMYLMDDNRVDRVFPANYNSPGQLVIAGYEQDVLQAAEGLRAAGARKVSRLPVSGAFHTFLMNPAAQQLKLAAADYYFAEPRYRLFSNFLGDELPAQDSMPEYLARHMVNPVRWSDEIRSLKRRGYTHYVECGPGKVLSKLIRRIDPEAVVANVENSSSLTATAALVREWLEESPT